MLVQHRKELSMNYKDLDDQYDANSIQDDDMEIRIFISSSSSEKEQNPFVQSLPINNDDDDNDDLV
ncbi:hypothetical protein DERP_014454 [Dermatophagoides pteronyssinus]|uniref:Uncharacterized protein n=1 Tax=Dermatophagoides pteronyssinus TaxID=6956 RepID=A0ABQ8IVW5_DERPT|nr:hypothetical protein DERP_014454 [Dermatophagoides pteronyssinus]